jgi:hypothetical protein
MICRRINSLLFRRLSASSHSTGGTGTGGGGFHELKVDRSGLLLPFAPVLQHKHVDIVGKEVLTPLGKELHSLIQIKGPISV